MLIVVIGVYIKRFDIAQWGLNQPGAKEKIKTEIKNAFMSEITPRLKEKIKLTFLQKAAVSIMGKRNEEQREKDAIKAVDRFITKELKEERLAVIVAKKLKRDDPDVYKKFEKLLSKYFIAIVWKYDGEDCDVVAALNISLKDGGTVTGKAVNTDAKFFKRIAEVAENAARGD